MCDDSFFCLICKALKEICCGSGATPLQIRCFIIENCLAPDLCEDEIACSINTGLKRGIQFKVFCRTNCDGKYHLVDPPPCPLPDCVQCCPAPCPPKCCPPACPPKCCPPACPPKCCPPACPPKCCPPACPPKCCPPACPPKCCPPACPPKCCPPKCPPKCCPPKCPPKCCPPKKKCCC